MHHFLNISENMLGPHKLFVCKGKCQVGKKRMVQASLVTLLHCLFLNNAEKTLSILILLEHHSKDITHYLFSSLSRVMFRSR